MSNNASRSSSRGSSVPMLKVVLLGDGGVGKSSLMNVFVHNKFDAQSFHTIGVEFLLKNITVERETFALQIWDTAGQERFKSLRTPFYRGADCCLLTFSVDDVNSFRNLSLWHQEFLYYADISNADTFPFVVLGNKVDIAETRVVSSEEASEWCRTNNMPYYETSAKNAINVELAFDAVVRRVRELERIADARRTNVDTVQLNTQQNATDSCC